MLVTVICVSAAAMVLSALIVTPEPDTDSVPFVQGERVMVFLPLIPDSTSELELYSTK